MKYFLILCAAAAALLTALFSSAASSAAAEALRLCSNVLIPSLFPFFVCANLLVSLGAAEYLSRGAGRIMKPIFKTGGAGALPLVLGFISGYPCGASVTCRMYDEGALSKNEAERLLAFTNNAGPLFIIGAVGNGLFGNAQIGALLYLSHVAGALMTGFLLSFFAKGNKKEHVQFSASRKPALSAVPDAVMSIINLCGYVVFFSVILSLMKITGITSLFRNILCFFGAEYSCAEMLSGGLLEMTSGLFSSGCRNIPCISALISFGGISVLLQTASFTRKSGLSLKYYIFGKLLCGGFSAATAKLMLHFFPLSITTFSPSSIYLINPYMNFFAAALIGIFPLIFFIFPRRE